jgi:hypothetical protein
MDRKRSSFYFSPVRWPRPLPRRRRRASACSARQDASGGVEAMRRGGRPPVSWA